VISFLRLGDYGRLGNQLFQIAATLGVASRNRISAVFPDWQFAPWINVETRPRSFFEQHEWKVVEASTFSFDSTINELRPHGNVSLEGYFQSERYFEDCKDLVRSAILTNRMRAIGARVSSAHDISQDNNCCAVHVRRGDYLKFADLFARLDIRDYYFQAMDLMREKHHVDKFILVSDDLAWCKTMMKRSDVMFSRNVGTFRDRLWNSARHRAFARAASLPWAVHLERYASVRDLRDMMLMAACRHHIIANSSFSWWSSWLSPFDDGTVVAPKSWFTPALPHDTKDLYRAEMILI
jgi:hypothetical protein